MSSPILDWCTCILFMDVQADHSSHRSNKWIAAVVIYYQLQDCQHFTKDKWLCPVKWQLHESIHSQRECNQEEINLGSEKWTKIVGDWILGYEQSNNGPKSVIPFIMAIMWFGAQFGEAILKFITLKIHYQNQLIIFSYRTNSNQQFMAKNVISINSLVQPV